MLFRIVSNCLFTRLNSVFITLLTSRFLCLNFSEIKKCSESFRSDVKLSDIIPYHGFLML